MRHGAVDARFWPWGCMLHNDPLVCMRKDPEWVRVIRLILLKDLAIWLEACISIGIY